MRNGIPILADNQAFYYGEVSGAEMQRVLEETELYGWRQAMWMHTRRVHSDYFLKYATAESRGSSKFFLSRFGDAVVLDYGCGVGTLTLGLARSFKAVIAADMTYERVAFAAARIQQEGYRNVTAVCCGDLQHIPLEDESVDIVVLNGVLEWVAEWRGGPVRQKQVEFMREVSRVLKPSGEVFVGIENRAAYRYWLGNPEDHTGLRFGALLPRPLANLYSRVVRRRPYRTYTYTRRGYRKLLDEAGFSDADFYALLPTYREIETVVDLGSRTMRQHSLQSYSLGKRIRNLALEPLLGWVTHSYGISATRESRKARPFFIEVLEHITRTHELGSFTLQRFSSSRSTPTLQLQFAAGQQVLMAKFALTSEIETRSNGVYEALPQVAVSVSGKYRTLVPTPVASGSFRGQSYIVTTALPGINLKHQYAMFSRVLEELNEFLIDLAENTQRGGQTWRSLIRAFVDRNFAKLQEVMDYVTGREQPVLQQLQTIGSWLKETAPDELGFSCAVHGDFTPGNVLVKKGKVSGIFDWDRFRKDGLPGTDLVYLLAVHLEETQPLSSGNEFSEIYELLNGPNMYSHAIHQYVKALQIAPELARSLVVLTWLQRLEIDLLSPSVFLTQEIVRQKMILPAKYFSATATKST